MNTPMVIRPVAESGDPPDSRLPGRVRFRGYGIMAQPFDSGHVLALRVCPETDYGPFRAVWHRSPEGAWSMYVDAPDPALFCPRFFHPILRDSGRARISVSWPGRHVLEIRMDEPELFWSVRLGTSALTRIANRVLPRLPLELYRKKPMLAAIGMLADKALRLGPMDLEGTFPAGQAVLVHPRRLFLVEETRANLDGLDLGRAAPAQGNPVTGSFRWPGRGVLAEGDIHVEPDTPTAGPPEP